MSYHIRNVPVFSTLEMALAVSPSRRKDRRFHVSIALPSPRMMRRGEAGFWFRDGAAKVVRAISTESMFERCKCNRTRSVRSET